MATSPKYVAKHARTRQQRGTKSIMGLATTAVAATSVVLVPSVSYAEPSRSIDDVQEEVDSLNHKAEVASERYNEITEQVRDAERRLDALQSRVDKQQKQLKTMEASMGNIAADSYRNGGVDPELQLLLSDDPDEFLRRASSLDQYSERQNAEIRELTAAREALAADKMAVAQELGELQKLRDKQAKEKAEIDRNAARAQKVLDGLEAEQRRELEERQAAEAARTAAANDAAVESTASTSTSTSTSSRAQIAVDFAKAQLGEAYVWGAAGPDAWDCSGLTMMAWKQAGVDLPHSSSMQYSEGTKVSRSNLQPGDLVYFYSPISHVGIYIGDGLMVHAPNPNETVKVDPISSMPYTGATRPS